MRMETWELDWFDERDTGGSLDPPAEGTWLLDRRSKSLTPTSFPLSLTPLAGAWNVTVRIGSKTIHISLSAREPATGSIVRF
jgi:hypothetical protein